MERNPYFWQVDPEGNQLPYIDRLTFSISQDVESLMLDAISGRLDIQERHIDTLQNKPTLSQNMQKGGYRLFELIAAGAQQVQIYLNITHKDPKMREMFANKEFRQALSLGIEPQGDHRHRLSRPVRALADRAAARASLVPREARAPVHRARPEARRTRSSTSSATTRRTRRASACVPTGRRCSSPIDVIPTLYPDAVDTLELVKRHWAEIGVDMKVNTIERALYYTRGDNNDHDAAVWPGPGGLDPMLDPRDFFAQHPQGSRYAIPWTLWYVSGGKDGQEPPESQKQRMKLFDEARATADLKKRGAIMKQLFDLTADAFETIGVCLAVNAFGIVKNNLQQRAAEVSRTPGPGRTPARPCRSSSSSAEAPAGRTARPPAPAARPSRGRSPLTAGCARPPGPPPRFSTALPCCASSSRACSG